MKNDFCFVPDLYTATECRDLLALTQLKARPSQDQPATGRVKTARVHQVALGDVNHQVSRFVNYAHHINQRQFGLELYQPTDLDILNCNTYESTSQGQYGWHRDAELGQVFDIKLTALLNLSEHYTGGDFELWLDQPTTITEFGPGSMLIFPSWLLHRVTPVLTGTRNTLTYFLTGPQLR
jgi:PKHD-type hydroxylase